MQPSISTTLTDNQLATVVSSLLGWIYFLCWSASFYPQALLLYRKKSSLGLSLDLVLYNVVGFLCYTIYSIAFLFVPSVREEYRRRNGGKDNLVQLNDLLFAANALIICILTAFMAFRYRNQTAQRVSTFSKAVLTGSLVLAIVLLLLSLFGQIAWLDFLYYTSGVKMMSTLFKYCPQVYMNYKRKSTRGWSIGNVLLDFTGGICSVSQLLLDAILADNFEGIAGNAVKLFLGVVSLLFDCIFIAQHYFIYASNSRKA